MDGFVRQKPYKPDQKRVEELNDWSRASGNCICDVCGFSYYGHQPVTGYTWLLKLCDGRLIKF